MKTNGLNIKYMIVIVSPKGEQFLKDVKQNPTRCKILLQPPPELIKFLKKKKVEISETDWVDPRSDAEIYKSKDTKTNKRHSKSTNYISLMKVSETSSSTLEDTAEIQEEKTLYRLLLNKRSELANSVNCMPYMVASNEVLLKMAQCKPTSVHELRNEHFNGFTEAKINKFGEEFIKIIRKLSNKEIDQESRTIEDLLAEHPLPDFTIGATATVTYSSYKSGMSVQEIATKRGLVQATILSHLIDGIKMGYPIKLIDLNVTDEIRNTIVSVIRGPIIQSGQ